VPTVSVNASETAIAYLLVVSAVRVRRVPVEAGDVAATFVLEGKNFAPVKAI